jgi:GNAT superfamily N-acetyltransferase
MKLTIRPLTPDLWPAFEDLFGRHGASNGCWCMYWRIGSEYRKRPREKNRQAFRRIVKRGPPPGLLAFERELAVGWCQLTPRSELPWLDRSRLLRRVDEIPVWSLSCFYVRRGYRRKGVMTALIAAAVEEARRAGAPALEAYPVDADHPRSSSNVWELRPIVKPGGLQLGEGEGQSDSWPVTGEGFSSAKWSPTPAVLSRS